MLANYSLKSSHAVVLVCLISFLNWTMTHPGSMLADWFSSIPSSLTRLLLCIKACSALSLKLLKMVTHAANTCWLTHLLPSLRRHGRLLGWTNRLQPAKRRMRRKTGSVSLVLTKILDAFIYGLSVFIGTELFNVKSYVDLITNFAGR